MSHEDVGFDIQKVLDCINELDNAVATRRLVGLFQNGGTPEGDFIEQSSLGAMGSEDETVMFLGRLANMAVYMAQQRALVDLN